MRIGVDVPESAKMVLMREDKYIGEFVLRNLEEYGGQGSHGTNAIIINLMHSNEVRKRYHETKARMLVNAAMTGNWPEGAPGPRNAARSIGLLLDRYGLDHGATGKLMTCTFRQLEDVMGKYEPRENDKGEVNAKLVTMLKWCRKEEGDVYWTESEVDFQEVWKEPGTGGRESRLHKRRRGSVVRQEGEDAERRVHAVRVVDRRRVVLEHHRREERNEDLRLAELRQPIVRVREVRVVLDVDPKGEEAHHQAKEELAARA